MEISFHHISILLVSEIAPEALNGYLIKRRDMSMKRFIQGEHRTQGTMLPEHVDDYITEDNQARVVDAFVDHLDLRELGFDGITPAETGRPSYHPAELLKIYIYSYLNRIQSSRRLEREAQRNIALMRPTCRLALGFKSIANFRKQLVAGFRMVIIGRRVALWLGTSTATHK